MSSSSAIEWTDATWNPVRGCVKVSPGCAHCYAETFAERFRGVKGHPYEQGFDVRLVPEKLMEPLKWRKPKRVFVNSMSDLFHDGVPDEYIDKVCAVMALCPSHTFQVLTKRPERMRDYMRSRSKSARFWMAAARDIGYALEFNGISLVQFPIPNVWLGVSVENQHFADERIPLLLQTPAAVRFISAEPLLGLVDLFAFLKSDVRDECLAILGHIDRCEKSTPGLDWVIVGGESGAGARPMSMDWPRSLVAQCKAAGVACFVKQLGAKPFEPYSDGTPFIDLRLRSKKGGDPTEWPSVLRIREFPVQVPAGDRPGVRPVPQEKA